MTRRAYRALVLAALPGSERDVKERTGLGTATVHRWLKDLHSSGEVHIGAWEAHPHGAPFVKVYHVGPGADVPCGMKAKTGREIRKAMRQSGDWEDVKAQRRAKYHAQKPVARRDPLMVGLFGPA